MSEINSKLYFIQYTLKKLTGKMLSFDEINDTYLRLFTKLQYKKTIMIAN